MDTNQSKVTCCMALLAASLVLSPKGLAEKKNPIDSSEESVSKGQMIYKKNCQMCHGEKGMGEGPAGQRMKPKPADFTNKSSMDKLNDGDLFQMITKGENPMPAFEHKLNETERWHVVNFIRTFAKNAPAN